METSSKAATVWVLDRISTLTQASKRSQGVTLRIPAGSRTEWGGRGARPFLGCPLSLWWRWKQTCQITSRESLSSTLIKFYRLWFKSCHLVGCEASSGMNLFRSASFVSIQGRPLWWAKSNLSAAAQTHSDNLAAGFPNQTCIPSL